MGEGIRKIAIGGLAAVACAAVLGLVAGAGVAVAAEVGFATIEVANGDEPALTGGVWYPTAAPAPAGQAGAGAEAVAIGAPLAGDGLPLVVISHGGGGAFDGHADTAVALARAGFVVAAVDHAGDDYKDQSLVLKL